ncbi:MAG TPA: PQQ-binding-like beta-propeller repeat protein [Pirellulales bacterium]|nr:PQQ-binding-like beta-propeller repeat protein [Pirellulales bacterium]
MRIFCLAAASVLMCLTAARAADWPNFRGPGGAALSTDKHLPVTWGDHENLVWQVELPGAGSSSPIVSGDRVFVTCYSGYGVDREQPGKPADLVRRLVCVGLRGGAVLWDKPLAAVQPEDAYQGMMAEHGYASHTPATDGERVYCFFGKSGVYAFDLEGNELWHASVGAGSAILGFGSGASLALYQDLVIVNANAESESLIALDKQSGRQVWKTEAKGYRGSWSTPVIVPTSGKPELVVNMPGEVWGLDPDDGGLYWFSTAQRTAGSTTAVAKDGIVYSLGGGPGGAMVTAIRTGGSGDVTESNLLWKKTVGSYVPSPVLVDGRLYWVSDQGIVYCLRADSGEQLFRERLGGGGLYASLIAADGKLYAVTRRNGAVVLAAGPTFEKLAHNRLESDTSDFNASPAVADGCLLLRSNRSLYCIGIQKP